MDGKLRILMQNEKLTASRLAEILEVKPATISHILSGRNKPSFEMLCKMINRFPRINPYWLLGDATEVYNSETTTSASTPSTPTPIATSGTLFNLTDEKLEDGENSNAPISTPNVPISTLGRSDIEKIIVVYSDQTFEELRPKR